jgi:hypothetical protein
MQTVIPALPMVLKKMRLQSLLNRLLPARPVVVVKVVQLPRPPKLFISHFAIVFYKDGLEMMAIASP